MPGISDINGARPLAIFGDSVTTDHISPPAPSSRIARPASTCIEQGVRQEDFNSYGARRGNHEVMVRGTFANVRIKNLMVPGVEGGVTVISPTASAMSIYDAAMEYQKRRHAAGDLRRAGVRHRLARATGRPRARSSSACGGRRAELRAHPPLQPRGHGRAALPVQGGHGRGVAEARRHETFDLLGLEKSLRPRQDATLVVHRASGGTQEVPVAVRIDTPIEVDYYRHGGILQYVLRQILGMA